MLLSMKTTWLPTCKLLSYIGSVLCNCVPFSNRIIRRRVVWLIGNWVGVRLAPELRSDVYVALLPLLEPSEDLVVRIETAATIRSNILSLLD